jgi:hypothetical protein
MQAEDKFGGGVACPFLNISCELSHVRCLMDLSNDALTD